MIVAGAVQINMLKPINSKSFYDGATMIVLSVISYRISESLTYYGVYMLERYAGLLYDRTNEYWAVNESRNLCSQRQIELFD